jgi:hypothetical protein
MASPDARRFPGQVWPEVIAERRVALLTLGTGVQTVMDRVGGSGVLGLADQ